MSREAKKQQIIDACIALIGQKGCRFTLDEAESVSGASRRTIYKYFQSKEGILKAIFNFTADAIHRRQEEIYLENDKSIPEKLYAIMTVESTLENTVNVSELYELQLRYPNVYAYFMEEYQKGWNLVEQLLQKGMDEGIYEVQNVTVVRNVLMNSIQALFKDEFFIRTNTLYRNDLEQIIHIVLKGITK